MNKQLCNVSFASAGLILIVFLGSFSVRYLLPKRALYDALESNLEAYRFRQALQNVMDIARLGNKYLTEKEPWKTIKINPADAKETLHNCLFIIGHLATAAQTFLPATAKRIFGMLNLPVDVVTYDSELTFTNGHQLSSPALLFEKVEDEVIDQQIQKLRDKKQAIEIVEELT